MWQEPCEQPGHFCFYGESCGVQSCRCELDGDGDAHEDAGTLADEDAGPPASQARWQCVVTLC
ncbi:MAG: hypothetical protein PVI30_19205 [Myxococcales bacterium]|jgi:hypothetical protein